MTQSKNRYLAVYDYGTGGGWVFIYARSASEIIRNYPELEIMDEQSTRHMRYLPNMTDAEIAESDRRDTYDIDEEPRGLLRDLVNGRTAK